MLYEGINTHALSACWNKKFNCAKKDQLLQNQKKYDKINQTNKKTDNLKI